MNHFSAGSRRAGFHWGAVVLFGLIVVGCASERSPDEPDESAEGPAPLVELGDDEVEVTLYFPSDGWYLLAEPRAVARWDSSLAGARKVLEELLAGPRSEALLAPLPDGVTIGETHLTADGRLYVDLVSSEYDRPPVSGSLAELLTVYSLVDSVLLNVPEIDSVVLLWNGRQPTTFAGHVDTSLPLAADEDLLARRR